MKTNYLTFFLGITSIILVCGCNSNEYANPCENITCLNNGECLHGNCICEDGYIGDLCENIQLPEAIYISEIILTEYPCFIENEPWDIGLSIPYCWPDIGIEITWPWGDSHLSYIQNNSHGDNLMWNKDNFPYIYDNHVHYEEEFLISIIEIDGLDSLEVVQPPENLETFSVQTEDFIFSDSLNMIPTFIDFHNQDYSIELRIYLDYSYIH